MSLLWTRNDPFREIDRFFHLMNRDIDQERGQITSTAPRNIRLDLHETRDKWMLQAELPGFRKEDVHVNVEGNRLIISGENKQENEIKETKRHIVERRYGKVERMITLPESADVEKVDAKFEDGILKLGFQKKEVLKTNEIKL